MLIDWTKTTVTDRDRNFQNSITESRQFQITPLDVWRIRSEIFVFVSSLTKMYENDRIQNYCEEPKSTTPAKALRLPDVLRFDFLWAIIQPGDIIEYVPYCDGAPEDVDHSKFIQRATVTAIRAELDGSTMTVQVNNGDRLVDSLHLVRRVAGRDPIHGNLIWNPLRDWHNLSRFFMVASEDAADGPDKPLDIEVDSGQKRRRKIRAKNKADMNKRAREKRGASYKDETATKKHDGHIPNDGKSTFLSWMDPRRIPDEISFLNRLYCMCLEIGNTAPFYNLIRSRCAESYRTNKHNLKRDVYDVRSGVGVIALKIMFVFGYFMSFVNVNGVKEFVPGMQTTTGNPLTKREMDRVEGTLKFEHENMKMKIQMCPCCMENHLNDVGLFCDPDEPYKCASCKRTKIPDTYFLDKKLLPVWYELKPNATKWDDYRLDEHGNRIVRYDIPKELAILSNSEQLLIRKAAPYIPSIHLSNGFYALTGQCVAFQQDLTDVCTDLPRHPDKIVTYIRQMGNSKTTAVHLTDLRVRKRVVLDALHWLKLHHREYRDITISESNLDWIGPSGESSVAGRIHNIRINGKQVEPSQPSVSKVQCATAAGDPPRLNCSIMSINGNELGMDPEQAELMDELVGTTMATNQKSKLLMFPQHADEPIK